jgi:hypothetical protein
MSKYTWLFFVAGAILTWGAYVVTIDHGRSELIGVKQAGKPLIPGPVAAMRAFLFIGLAYFVMGVIVPWIYLKLNPVDPVKFPSDPGYFKRGVTLSTVAGILGAGGAHCIVFAVGYARQAGVSPGAVASLVFCFAPIVNVIISMIIEPPDKAPSPAFFVGILMAAVGAGMVLYFKPEPAKHGPPPPPKSGFPVSGHAVLPPQQTQPSNPPGQVSRVEVVTAKSVIPVVSRKMHYPPPVVDFEKIALRLTEEFDAMWDRAMRSRYRDQG